MRLQSADDLFLTEVQDLYDAEKQLLRTLPRMAKSSDSEELVSAFREHVDVTRTQISRLEQIFEMLGQRAKSHPCKGMKGIVEEAQEVLQEEAPSEQLHDCAIAGAARKAEHYEMAGYLSAHEVARGLGHKDAAALLAESLEEEKEMDKRLKQLSTQLLKMAQKAKPTEEEEAPKRGARSASTSAGNGRQSSAPARKASKGGNGGGRSASRGGGEGSRKGGKKQSGQTTTDHDEIRQWAEARGAHPACVRGTGKKGDTGMIRLDFPGFSGGDSLEEISWDEFFEQFEANNLALVYQDKTASGETSNFNKLVSREK